jgi:hypothetical protein
MLFAAARVCMTGSEQFEATLELPSCPSRVTESRPSKDVVYHTNLRLVSLSLSMAISAPVMSGVVP